MTVPSKPAIAPSQIAAHSPQPSPQRRRVSVDQRQVWLAIATLTLITVLTLASPAFAHHPLGGTTPQTALSGLLSGLGHPVIGPDHLAFVLAVGLLSAQLAKTRLLIGSFLLAALAGVGLHLLELNLPAPEVIISLSVLLLGGLVAQGKALPTLPMLLLTAGAGLFHGYAYGEAIVGAEPTPLLAYLVGLTMVQGAIAGSISVVLSRILSPAKRQARLQAAGLVACGAGLAFLSAVVLG